MTSLKKQELDMSTYLGQVQAVMEEFETLMPVSTSIEKQQEQRQKMFLVLTLAGLPNDLDSARDQILANPTVPTVDELFSRLLRLAAAPSHPVSSSHTLDSSVLVSQSVDNRASQTMENRRGGGHFGRSKPKCSYCHKLGHTRDVCYSLHGRPPKNAYVAQTETTCNKGFSLSEGEYNEFLQYRASKQTSPQVASVAQTDTSVAGNSFTCVSQSSTLGQWVLDSAASDHISDNKSLLSNIAYFTLANVSQTKAKGVGQANPLASVMLDSVLYVPGCPFNLASQNGVAERKNRHIIETARTLLIESHVPLHFWGDAVLTACYLVNRMPSSPIQNQTPYAVLFPRSPLYFVLPCVFGSTCFVHNLAPGKDKLAPRALKCVFLGYSRVQKGYRCYSLDLQILPIPTVEEYSVAPPTLLAIGTPLLTYHRHLHPASGPADSRPAPDPAPTTDLSLPSTPIALRKGWRQAMIGEMTALHTSGTWELVPLPSGKSIVGCRWVYAVKLDMKNAFLHGDLEDEIYMEQPPGFVAQGESRGLVCLLCRSLYGLKQFPRAWFGNFSTVIQEFGMTRSEADHSVFYRHSCFESLYLSGGLC
uniref:Uncharacterized protein LOC104210695 n=1 Tax=Nicotiana sylvestris TaxID=4096 RepID=A0A1U7V842_NICSY|nr:PREDICTED: uncharacterized protein LOC104210695 [Nicotiana sylvestris]